MAGWPVHFVPLTQFAISLLFEVEVDCHLVN